MASPSKIRLVVFGLVTVLSLIVFAMAASNVKLLGHTLGEKLHYLPLGLIVGVLTVFFLGASLIVNRFRQNAVFCHLIVELPVTGVLAVLWWATGIDASTYNHFFLICKILDLVLDAIELGTDLIPGGIVVSELAKEVLDHIGKDAKKICHGHTLVHILSYMNGIILGGYVLYIAIKAPEQRYPKIWFYSVADAFAPRESSEKTDMEGTKVAEAGVGAVPLQPYIPQA